MEKLTSMPYNHRLRDGALECAYVATAPTSFATDYHRWPAGPGKGTVVVNRFGNATCNGCLRDVPAPTDQPTYNEFQEDDMDDQDVITEARAIEAWEKATELCDAEDGGLTTHLIQEVIFAGARYVGQPPEPGALMRLRNVIRDVEAWYAELAGEAYA